MASTLENSYPCHEVALIIKVTRKKYMLEKLSLFSSPSKKKYPPLHTV